MLSVVLWLVPIGWAFYVRVSIILTTNMGLIAYGVLDKNWIVIRQCSSYFGLQVKTSVVFHYTGVTLSLGELQSYKQLTIKDIKIRDNKAQKM